MSPAGDVTQAPDPFEPVNRASLQVNLAIEKVIFRPVNTVYRTIFPAPVRTGLANAYANSRSPIIFVNDILQGQPQRAGRTLLRFIINSTVGVGGLLDVAAANGIHRHSEDFGQTLGVWGVKNGPYLVLPILGPTTFRDGVGSAVDIITDPLFWLFGGIDDTTTEGWAYTGAAMVIGFDTGRDDLEELQRTSIDFYAALRSAYLQHRQSEVLNGASDAAALPDILDTLPPIE
ncbi:MlaA family lipoprotein [Rhodoligotrophos ferricapiens]|uniref:MlaA family lipoprotein n=1 Tax=Rhodoligotrophos ferricapiens TaxID=3069264 RepID=UPI00315D8B22